MAMDRGKTYWTLFVLTLIGSFTDTGSENVKWKYKVRLDIDHMDIDKPTLMKRATNFTQCVFHCFLESADLKPSIFVWNLQESSASDILTTNNSIMVTCSKNSSDPQTVSTWASQSYSDASLIDDVCDPLTTFRGLKKRGVHVQFECAANGKACNNGDLCAGSFTGTGSENVKWKYKVRLDIDHTGDKTTLMKRATDFIYCVFNCFLESADLKPSIFVWNLQESPASRGQYILTTNNSIMVTCSKNSSDPHTVSTWASQSYSDASLIDDVCDPLTFRGLKKRGVHVQFECAANGKACNSGDLCAGPNIKKSKQKGASNNAAIAGGAAGATALASTLAGLVYYLRKLKMRKIRDSTTTSPQGSTADLVPDVPHVFFEPAQTSQFPTRTH